MADLRKYDLELFLQLNKEYESKPVLKIAPPLTNSQDRLAYKRKYAFRIMLALARYIDLRGKRVLDFGCGKGDFSYVLANDFGCAVTGVDINEYPEWTERTHPSMTLLAVDLCDEANAKKFAGQFDVIISISVLEHVRHPYQALTGLKTVLKPGGAIWLQANLYRGPLASHCYRDVYFPWPHLLFSDEVFAQFFAHIGKRPTGASWVNKLTHLHYRDYFERIGFEVRRETFSRTPLDEEFYHRFEEILGRYPRWDLERDFIQVILRHQ